MQYHDAAPRRATLHLHRGTYAADHAELTGGIVTFAGRRIERDLTGTRAYERVTRSHRLKGGEFVEWEAADLEAVA